MFAVWLASLPGFSKGPAMKGTSDFQEMRSSSFRSATNRFLHGLRHQYKTGFWPLFRTPISHREEVVHMAAQLRVKNSFLHHFCFFTASHSNVSKAPEKVPESVAVRCVWERIGHLLICLIIL